MRTLSKELIGICVFQDDVSVGLHSRRQPTLSRRQGAERRVLLPPPLGAGVPDSGHEERLRYG